MDEEKILNLTPHDVNIVGEDGKVIKIFPASGQIARLVEQEVVLPALKVEGTKIPLYKKSLKEVQNLPEEREGVFYIVSLPVAQSLPQRRDLLVPHKLVRDEKGRVVGTKALATLSGGDV